MIIFVLYLFFVITNIHGKEAQNKSQQTRNQPFRLMSEIKTMWVDEVLHPLPPAILLKKQHSDHTW